MSSANMTGRDTDPRDDEDSWREWYCLTPLQRWHESMKLWQFYLRVGGSLDPNPMEWEFLDRGHAIHFRCKHADVLDIRLDVMSKMRGCDGFAKLWDRRTTLEDGDGTVYELLGIEDLIRAKKTQRDKDWPMITRLVDAHYNEFRSEPNEDRVRFWLRESRSTNVLIQVGKANVDIISDEAKSRPLLAQVTAANEKAILDGLQQEQAREKEADQAYWNPLKLELEQLRRNRI